MKNLFLSLLAMFAVVGTVSAQDAPVNRSLSFYLDSFTGHLTEGPGYKDGDDSRILSGNEFEFGMIYSQNFATVPWLSMWVKALVVTGTTAVNDWETGDFLGNGSYMIQGYGNPRAQVGINLGGYAIFAMDTRGLLAQENYYTLRFGAAGALTFQTILEMWMIPLVSNVRDLTGNVIDQKLAIVDLFEIRLSYEIGFAPGWTYRSKLGFRLSGNESAEAFAQSFYIRWENQVVWAVTPKFYTWMQLRYTAANITHATEALDNQLFLQAGLGYSFDFSNN